jgi:hypothetical protein
VPTINPAVQIPPALDIAYHPYQPILAGPINLYHIFWGSFKIPRTTKQLVDYFATYLGNSSWYRTVTSYYQINRDGSLTYASRNATLRKSIEKDPTLTAVSRSVSLTDADIQLAITDAISSGNLPLDEKAVYTIIFRGDFSVTNPSLQEWLVGAGAWCSYHSFFAANITGKQAFIKYAVVGDPSTAPNNEGAVCEPISSQPTANGNIGADSIVNEYATQLVNVVTNWNGAWYFDTSHTVDGLTINARDEAGSVCASRFGNYSDGFIPISNIKVGEKSFLVHELWKPLIGCVL